MKFDITSDWHLNWMDNDVLRQEAYSTLVDKSCGRTEADNLIIAGDITDNLQNALEKDDLTSQFVRDVLVDVTGQYNRTFIVMGNHDYWHNKVGNEQKVRELLKEKIGEYVTLLNFDEVVELEENINIIGGNYWTNLEEPTKQNFAQFYMNDYRFIKDFRPEDSNHIHKENKTFIEQTLTNNPKKTFIIVTHTSPSYSGITPEYREQESVCCFASNDDDLFNNHKNVRAWVFGHSHESNEVWTGWKERTQLFNNAAGYRFDTNYRFKKLVV